MSCTAAPDGEASHRYGHVALVGRPNVGKSTLMNRLVGQKVSIVTRRPQTTRNQILGILSTPEAQVVFLDTPGMHLRQRRALNRYMNRIAEGALEGVDLAVFMVEAGRWTDEDQRVAGIISARGVDTILAVNKVDRIRDKSRLLPYLEARAAEFDYVEIMPLSVINGHNVEALRTAIIARMPIGAAAFPTDQVTDRSVRFLAAEMVREKLTRRLGQELPYGLGVEIEEFDESESVVQIGAVVWLEKSGHKPIVIGKGGALLKAVGTEARADLEAMLERRIYLRLWVKVRDGWSDSERLLRQLGYDE